MATTLQALAAPSRLLILSELRQGPRAVSELAEAVGMEQSAVSHQLRLLRNLDIVVGTRSGRHIVYSLFDLHVAQLLDEAIRHTEHRRLGLTDDPGGDRSGADRRAGLGGSVTVEVGEAAQHISDAARTTDALATADAPTTRDTTDTSEVTGTDPGGIPGTVEARPG